MLDTSQQALLVVDDLPLRQERYKSAEKIMRKIDRVQSSLNLFQQKDQQLFKQWAELTFRDEREQIQKLHGEYRELTQFHNWMIATSALEHVPLYVAYQLIKQEALAYSKAGPKERERIEREREKRDRYIDEEALRQEQEKEERRPPRRRASNIEEEAYARVWKMNREELAEICEDGEVAFELLSLSLRLSEAPEDYELFLRIWDTIADEQKKEFGEAFEHKYGTPIEPTIAEMRETFQESEQDLAAEPELQPLDEERIKIRYRHLVRRLHPDMHGQEAQAPWYRRFWERAQSAYRQKNLGEIEELLRLTLLRQKQLHDLTVSEITESCRLLERELEQLRGETKGLRRQPAWGFSRGKNLESLSRRVRRELERDSKSLKSRITELQMQHAHLARLSDLL